MTKNYTVLWQLQCQYSIVYCFEIVYYCIFQFVAFPPPPTCSHTCPCIVTQNVKIAWVTNFNTGYAYARLKYACVVISFHLQHRNNMCTNNVTIPAV